MERPALKRLLADIAAGRIDVVVVYKVDRLTRSLADFAKIVEVFDAQSVSFVSVTQAFNTTTQHGAADANVLLSFAQFEREVTGERIRDKIAASKKKGLWMGGQPSLGYDVRDRKLVVNEAEAETVRMIFRRYLDLGSVRELKAALDAEGVVSKHRTAADGSPMAASPSLAARSTRCCRTGSIAARSSTRARLSRRTSGHRRRGALAAFSGGSKPTASSGGRQDARAEPSGRRPVRREGEPMTPTHAIKKGVRYRYYVSRRLITGIEGRRGKDQMSGQRIPAANLEGLVIHRLRSFFADPTAVLDSLPRHRRDAPSQRRANAAATEFVRALDEAPRGCVGT